MLKIKEDLNLNNAVTPNLDRSPATTKLAEEPVSRTKACYGVYSVRFLVQKS